MKVRTLLNHLAEFDSEANVCVTLPDGQVFRPNTYNDVTTGRSAAGTDLVIIGDGLGHYVDPIDETEYITVELPLALFNQIVDHGVTTGGYTAGVDAVAQGDLLRALREAGIPGTLFQ